MNKYNFLHLEIYLNVSNQLYREIRKENRKDFNRFARFGIVDSSLLMISLLAGFSLDAVIAKHIGARVLWYFYCYNAL
jgi:hypothetical protein